MVDGSGSVAATQRRGMNDGANRSMLTSRNADTKLSNGAKCGAAVAYMTATLLAARVKLKLTALQECRVEQTTGRDETAGCGQKEVWLGARDAEDAETVGRAGLLLLRAVCVCGCC